MSGDVGATLDELNDMLVAAEQLLYPCDGCCPNGCRPHGLQRMQDEAQRRANALFGEEE